MTPCYICSRPISELRLDGRDMKTKPCMTCEAVIAEAAKTPDREKQDIDNEEFANLSLMDYLSTKRTYNDWE